MTHSAHFLASTFILLFSFLPFSFAQDKIISWEEKYSDESYVYILIEQTVEVEEDWSSEEKVHMIAKVQKEDAKSLGEIPVEYDKSFQEVRDIKAYILPPDGKKLKYKSIQDLNPYSGSPLYSDNRIKVITMPNVVPGSVIDWEATIVTKKPVIKNTFWDLFNFTTTIPTKSLTCKLIMPKGMSIEMMARNTDIKPQVQEKGDKIIYLWQKAPLDKIEPEEHMPPLDEIIQYVMMSNLKDWKDVSKWYWDLVNKNLKISPQMKEGVKKLIKDKNKPEDKIQAIIKYIQDNFRYVSMGFGYNCYEPHPSDEVFNNKYGDCKDQVLVCMAMLKEAGITSYPALFCGEDLGNPKDKLPMPSYFNHVILCVELDTKVYYVDILQKGYRFNENSPLLSGGYVFVVNDKEGFFEQVPILDESENTHIERIVINIKEDGSAVIDDHTLWAKDLSVGLKKEWKELTDKQKDKFMESLEESLTAGGKMIDKKWENMNDEYGRIKTFMKYERPRWAEVSGDFMTFGTGGYKRDVEFGAKKRIYPIMIRANFVNRAVNTYSIPEGFEIINRPKNICLKSEFAEFFRTYKIDGQRITEMETRRYKRARLPVSDYEKVKQFFNKLSQLTNEKIIIKKTR